MSAHRDEHDEAAGDRMLGCRPAGTSFKGEGERLRADWRARRELFVGS